MGGWVWLRAGRPPQNQIAPNQNSQNSQNLLVVLGPVVGSRGVSRRARSLNGRAHPERTNEQTDVVVVLPSIPSIHPYIPTRMDGL